MKNVVVIDRKTGRKEQEKIMGHSLILFIYSAPWPFKIFGLILQVLLCHFHGVSRLYGQYQKSRLSQKNILPFIKKYNVDTREFAHSLLTFKSFNDFFIRTLKKTARPLDSRPHHALCPADGRYLAFQNTKHVKDFWIKGKKFDLATFLGDKQLAKEFHEGSMVIARLCPSDYHRFHFPVSGTPKEAKLINGALFSVNPIALYHNFLILQENKRVITLIDSDQFGKVAYIEIGATNVGSIIQTYLPLQLVQKGDEKGYFSFGGSCVVILFMKGKINLEDDLLENTLKGYETKALMGQSLGFK